MNVVKRVYEGLTPTGQSWVDRFRYRSGRLPRVNLERSSQSARLPQSFRGGLVISADFELAWAWRYIKNHKDPLGLALEKARQTRENFPRLLELFDQYDAPVTWATVGHLFLDHCERRNGATHPNLPRLPYFENEYWRYQSGDWFNTNSCAGMQSDSAWYAPDLIRAILSTKTKHEIACHTFSHIDCSEGNCPPQVIDAELAECQRVASEWGIALKTFVFPGNLLGNLAMLKRNGISAYRLHDRYHLDVPRKDDLGMWQIPGGLGWELPPGWKADAWIGVLRRCIDRALETGTVLHLWFHPSCPREDIDQVFPSLLDYVVPHRNQIWMTTMSGLSDACAQARTS